MQPIDVMQCPITSEIIQSMYEDESIIIHISYGRCETCKKTFSKDALNISNSNDIWPICYEGYYCKPCYEKPLTMEEAINAT